MASNMRNRKKPKPRPNKQSGGLISKVRKKLGGGKNNSAFGLAGQKRTMNKPKPTATATPSKSKTTGPVNRVTKNKARMDYPVYKKSTPEAGSFRSAYAAARKAKKAGVNVKGNSRTGFSYNAKSNVFTWKGKKYKAESAGEKAKRTTRSNADLSASAPKKPKKTPSKPNKVSRPRNFSRMTRNRYGGGQGGF